MILCPSLALAADDDLLDDEEPASTTQPSRPTGGQDDLLGEDEEPDVLAPSGATGVDLLDDDLDGPATGAADSADVYRKQQEAVRGMDADEEMMAWEAYLARYPNTAFRDRIEKRMDALNDALYGGGIGDGDGEGPAQGDQTVLAFSQGLQLENINPRERLQMGFEWGLPSYMNLLVDYERPLQPNLSVHGGFRHRATGWSAEAGVRYAAIRSVRHHALLTVVGDLRFNTSPAFLAIRPMVAGGKRFSFGEYALDVQAQLAPDLQARGKVGFPLVGGGNVTFYANDTVALFAETSLNMKWVDDYAFRFNVFSFGIKFFPGEVKGKWEANLGGSAPYGSQYWASHFGAVMGQANLYLDE